MTQTAAGLAAVLREQIRDEKIKPGEQLPTMTGLMKTYGASRSVAQQALVMLKSEGLADYRPGRGMGTFVRERPVERMIRSRRIERDDMGYYSGHGVQHWRPLPGTTTVTADRPAPADIARLLNIEPGTLTLVRERFNGDPGRPEHCQGADSWLHPDVVTALPRLRQGSTGLGGMYDRIEEWAEGPLSWEEEVTAAIPSPKEVEVMLLPPGVALLRILRSSTIKKDGKAMTVEVQDIRMSSALFSVKYPIQRHGDAKWPVRPAGTDFYSG